MRRAKVKVKIVCLQTQTFLNTNFLFNDYGCEKEKMNSVKFEK